jgi:mono/diheme cytochrome c family protein
VVANQAGDAPSSAGAPVANSFYVIASNAVDGKIAYDQVANGLSCATCHGTPGSQATSRIPAAANADLVRTWAILNNLGGMGVLSGNYTHQQIVDIASSPGHPGDICRGRSLANNCKLGVQIIQRKDQCESGSG